MVKRAAVKRPSKMDRKLSTPDQPKRPRDRALPGMEDGPIRELEAVAADYAELRDRRQALSADEAAFKRRVMALMHKHQKTTYQRNGIKIWLEPGEEDVKVRVKPASAEDGDDEPEDPQSETETADA